MASEWQKACARLSSLVTKIRSGATPKGGAESYLPARQRYALIRSQNVFDHRFDEKGLAFISDQQARDLAGAELQANDVLLNITGDGITFGRACLVPDHVLPACVNQHVMLIRTNRDLCYPRYLAAWLALPSTKAHIESFNSGGSRRAITKGHIESFDVPLPPIELQRIIGDLSANINDRIDNLRQINATLETIAAALFKSWFVDFDSMPPENMQESEQGLIPKGWRVASLDAIADYLNGLALQKFPPESETEFLPVIKIAQLRAGNTQGADKASTKLKLEYIVEDGDVLFSWSGSLEVEVWTGGHGALNQHLFKITSRVVPKWFYYFATRLHLPDFRAIAASKATTMGHIQRKHLTDAKVVVPSPDAMTKFDSVIAPLFEQRINNALQARTLTALRDTLLPRLIAGQLRVNQ